MNGLDRVHSAVCSEFSAQVLTALLYGVEFTCSFSIYILITNILFVED
jgi:hypothetical protein